MNGCLHRYREFLDQSSKAVLLDASEDFSFHITSVETPNLVVRDVQTQGHASNQHEQGDAFFGLMLSHGSGSFSSGPLPPTGSSSTPGLHWHLPKALAVSHHRDSRVTYVRLEAASLLRHLALAGISVSQLTHLQARELPQDLVQLITQLGPRIAGAPTADQPALVEAFLADLCHQFQAMLAPSAGPNRSAALHAAGAIQRLVADLGSSPGLAELSAALGLTPRAVQASFRNRLDIAPMRWLKLHQLSRLRLMLHNNQHGHLAPEQLKRSCGLKDTRSARAAYREVYGLTPAEEQHRARLRVAQGSSQRRQPSSQQFHFTSTAEAIHALHQIEAQRPPGQSQAVRISIEATIPWDGHHHLHQDPQAGP